MNYSKIIQQTEDYVRKNIKFAGSGHDWWHIRRVWNNALSIGNSEDVDMFVVQLSALLHDIADWKFHDGDFLVGIRKAKNWLSRLKVNSTTIDHVCEIIEHVSFRGANIRTKMRTKEGMVVQDADRLDAMGAIGIARTFAYGGYKDRLIYDPNRKPQVYDSTMKYLHGDSPSINHFYEKLLLLKNLMNTPTAKRIAQKRHRYMLRFLDEFYAEWEGRL